MKRFTSGERLKQIMSERNLKQVDILNMTKPYQKKLGIKLSKSHLSNYVNDNSTPHQNSIYLLSLTLNVSEGWLMGYDVEKERVPDSARGNEVNDSQNGLKSNKATPSAKLAVKINRRKSALWNELATDLLQLSDDGVGQLIPVVKGLLAAEQIKKETPE